jgi:hypothetical protein
LPFSSPPFAFYCVENECVLLLRSSTADQAATVKEAQKLFVNKDIRPRVTASVHLAKKSKYQHYDCQDSGKIFFRNRTLKTGVSEVSPMAPYI